MQLCTPFQFSIYFWNCWVFLWVSHGCMFSKPLTEDMCYTINLLFKWRVCFEDWLWKHDSYITPVLTNSSLVHSLLRTVTPCFRWEHILVRLLSHTHVKLEIYIQIKWTWLDEGRKFTFKRKILTILMKRSVFCSKPTFHQRAMNNVDWQNVINF